ncbi:MAG: methionyl-tRNA formyltransferase [Chlamydiota bacterium]
MRAVFFGTPDFAAYILRFLAKKHLPLIGIVTQPDRRRGRNQKVQASSVKIAALDLYPNVPLFQPAKASDPQFIEAVKKLAPDIFIVVAYGQILRKQLLDLVKLPINIHASLLPKYRGAAPMQRALMAGESETGITIMKMNEKMDEGDSLLQESIQVEENMTLGELEPLMKSLACKLLYETLQNLPPLRPQNHEEASYAPKLLSEELFIDWNRSALEIHNQIRALSPKPGAWSFIYFPEQTRCKILKTGLAKDISQKYVPGEVLSSKNRLLIGTKKGVIELFTLQIAGKNSITAPDFLRGRGQGSFSFTEN